MQIPDGSTIGDLITQLALPISLEALLVVVDNKIASLDQLLRSNDQINLMPALSGG